MTQLPGLQTPRLRLRPFQPTDVDLMHAMWTDPHVRRYLWDDIVIPRERVLEVFDLHHETVASARIGFWVVIHEATGKPAGFCGVRFFDDTKIELMYGLMPEFWGHGLAVEASRAVLDYVWSATPFERVYARTDPPNTRSAAVMARLGMTHESSTDTTIAYFIDRPRPPEAS